MFLDLGHLRAVHACWDEKRIDWLKKQSLESEAFLRSSAEPLSQAHRAIENVLKGPELPMPGGEFYLDKENVPHHRIRARWWNLPDGNSPAGLLAMPEPFECKDEIPGYEIRRVPNYSEDGPPVFFGHYWMPPHLPKEPLAPNLACLDYSGGLGDDPLVAYRWDGESILSGDKYHFARKSGENG